ncbi:MAG: flagellar basal body-associated FliL family protein [Pseudomonadales bacterium]|nr:flagellar basal body-associated FliL family protein [Pseudomonadales bacterium]
MADDIDEEEAGESGGGGKKKLIIIIAIVLLLLGAVAGGAIYYMNNMMQDESSAEEGDEEADGQSSGGLFSSGPGHAIYHKMRPAFVTTFEANNKQRYMQLELTLVTRESEVVSALINHNPLIRNTLVLLFAAEDYVELQTPAGKEALKEKSLKAVQTIMQREIGSRGIEAILFTNFVMQ